MRVSYYNAMLNNHNEINFLNIITLTNSAHYYETLSHCYEKLSHYNDNTDINLLSQYVYHYYDHLLLLL